MLSQAASIFIAFYHMGIYGDPVLLRWFTTEYSKAGVGK